MLKKILTNSKYSVLVVSMVLVLVLLYQFMMGARLVYFLPDYPVLEENSYVISDETEKMYGPYHGFDKCYFYGSCFALADGVSLKFVEPLLLLILIYYAFIAGRELIWFKNVVGVFIVGVLYIVLAQIKNLDWFSHCSEFCGIEYLFFLWIPLLISLLAGFIYAIVKSQKKES